MKAPMKKMKKPHRISVRLSEENHLTLFLAVQDGKYASISIAVRALIEAFAESRKTTEQEGVE